MIDENYLHSAALYDQLNAGMAEGLASRLISKLDEFDIKIQSQLLDIGCGTGTLVNKFSEAGYSVCGIDPSHSMIAQAKTKYPKLEFDVASPTQFLQQRKFDLIMSTNDAINYLLPEELSTTMLSIRNGLRDGGFLYVDFTTETDFVENWENQRLDTKIDNWQLSRKWNFDPSSYTGTETQSWSILVDGKKTSFNEIHTLYPINPVVLADKLKEYGFEPLSFFEPEHMTEPELDISSYIRLGLLARKSVVE